MSEHLDLDYTSGWSAYLFFVYDSLDFLHLSEIQLACKHDHVGELCVEAQSLDVRDAQLCRDVHLYTDLTGIDDGCHVGCNYCCDAGFLCCIQGPSHVLKIFPEKGDVEGEVCLYAVFRADLNDFLEVGHLEVVC